MNTIVEEIFKDGCFINFLLKSSFLICQTDKAHVARQLIILKIKSEQIVLLKMTHVKLHRVQSPSTFFHFHQEQQRF